MNLELELKKIIFYVDRKCTVNLLYFNGGTLLGCQAMHSFDVIGQNERISGFKTVLKSFSQAVLRGTFLHLITKEPIDFSHSRCRTLSSS